MECEVHAMSSVLILPVARGAYEKLGLTGPSWA